MNISINTLLNQMASVTILHAVDEGSEKLKFWVD